MASAVDKQPAAARLPAVAAAGCLPTATRGSQSSYTTLWDTTRVEKRPPKLDLDVYPYLPKATVGRTSAASYMCLLSEDAA